MIAPTNQSNPTNRSKVHVFPHFFINRYDNISSSFICLLYTTPQYKTVYAVPVTAFGSDEDIAKWIGTGVNMTILPAI